MTLFHRLLVVLMAWLATAGIVTNATAAEFYTDDLRIPMAIVGLVYHAEGTVPEPTRDDEAAAAQCERGRFGDGVRGGDVRVPLVIAVNWQKVRGTVGLAEAGQRLQAAKHFQLPGVVQARRGVSPVDRQSVGNRSGQRHQ